jgi:hypothetical protein
VKRWMPVALAVQGFFLAAVLPASAQKTVKLFGTTYNVAVVGRDQTFKTDAGKQVKVVLTAATDDFGSWTQKAGLFFAEGADATKDRLLVCCHLDSDTDGPMWHQAYMLTGAGDDGMFAPASATLTEWFGGAQDRTFGGRPLAIMLINTDDTGVKKDRNVVMFDWTGDNGTHLFDLDSMTGKYQESEVFFNVDRVVANGTEEKYTDVVADENQPGGDYSSFAPVPTNDGHTIITIGTADNGGSAAGVWDTKTDKYFPILTDLSAQTASASTPIATDRSPHAVARFADNEYWILASDVYPTTSGTVVGSQNIYRVKLTLPADPSKGKAEDIKVEVLGKEELVGTALQTNDTMNYGMAIGREVSAGKRRIYFGSADGKLIVATPQ